jgi:hypothetical protein
MELNMEIENRGTYLYTRVYGAFNIQKAKELFKEAVDAATKYNLNAILVDFRAIEGNSITTSDRYEYSNCMADVLKERRIERGLPTVRLAYVGRVPFLDQRRFGETVAVNRGVMMKATDNFKEAMSWLLNKEKAAKPLHKTQHKPA